jgi:predicted RNA-binding Zn ribbon-like protein
MGINGSPSSVKRIKKPNGKEKGRKEKKKAKLVETESSPTLNIKNKNVDELDKRASLDSNDLSKFDKSLSTTGAKTNLSSSVHHLKSIYGQKFYASSSGSSTNSFDLNRFNFSLNNTTYISVTYTT